MYRPRTIRFVLVLLAGLSCSGAMRAQVQVGDNTKLSLSGTIGFGYAGDYGTAGSSHGLDVTGTGTLNGYYYNPSFLSFNVQPFYDRSQSDSSSQSLFNDKGVTATMNLFSGSHFPGSISYNWEANGTGQFGLPGISGLTTESSTHGLNIVWSELVPKLPTLDVTYSSSSSSASLLGEDGTSDSSLKSLNLNSTYHAAGFQFNGFYHNLNTDNTFPSFLGTEDHGQTSTNNIGLLAFHRLPLSGNFSANWNWMSYTSGSGDSASSGTSNSAAVSASIMPFKNFSVSSGMRYTGNVAGALQQSLVPDATVPLIRTDTDSNSMAFDSYATYTINRNISANGHFTHRMENFAGQEITDTLYGGTVNFNYAKPLFGMLHFSVGMVDTANQEGNSGMGLVANVGAQRQIRGWDTSADFSYNQDVQTLIAIYTTSSYSYGAAVRRKFTSNTYWSGSFRATHSALTQQAGSDNQSESISSNLLWRRCSVAGNYSESHGTSVLTSNGVLVATPVAPLLTEDFVFHNGRSYGLGLGLSPFRRMTLTGSFTNVHSDTLAQALASTNTAQRYDLRLEYKMRKLYFRAGFTHIQQGITGVGGGTPVVVNSYYFNISRWFNIF